MSSVLKVIAVAAALSAAAAVAQPAMARADIQKLQFMQQQACSNHASAKRAIEAATARMAAAQAKLAAAGSDQAAADAARQAIADAQTQLNRGREDLGRASQFYQMATSTLNAVRGASVCSI